MSQPHSKSKFKSALKLVVMLMFVPLVYIAGASISFMVRERRANAEFTQMRMPEIKAVSQTTRLMVFSPHCDDETLGCAGLIQQTLAAGGDVEVVFLTNGDAFRTGVECMAHTTHVHPADFIRYAALRQGESQRALMHLGVPKSHILFLGFPDGGSMHIWENHWSNKDPFTSPFTDTDSVPYKLAVFPHTLYCGSNIVHAMQSLMEQFKPTIITITHPQDDHPDHEGASAFVTLSYDLLKETEPALQWTHNSQLLYYLVHRGDWPTPEGLYPDMPLTPPHPMAYLDTRWMTLPLTPQQTEMKLQSIDIYKSQTAMMGRFLRSFARKNEMFGSLPEETLYDLPTTVASPNETPSTWQSIPPVLLNPQRDDMLRALNGGANICAVFACKYGESLHVLLELRSPVSTRFRYQINLRPVRSDGHSSDKDLAWSIYPNEKNLPEGVITKASGRWLLFDVPWNDISTEPGGQDISFIGISAHTSLSEMEVDKTGVRLLRCTPSTSTFLRPS